MRGAKAHPAPRVYRHENPLFSPELVWPTTGASAAHGSMTKSSGWIIPEPSVIPLYIPPPREEVDDEGCDELLPGHMTHRSHVPSGQRHALLTHHNVMFERRIGSNTPLPQLTVTNNGKY
jgi:hypothetical protein